MLGGELAVLQAPMFDGFSFDPVTLGEDGGTASEVDIGGGQIVEALVVSAVVVVINERLDLRFEVARQVVVFQQDSVLQGLVPALDLALGLRMVGRPADMGHALLVAPFGKFAGDVTRAVVAEQPRSAADMGLVAT